MLYKNINFTCIFEGQRPISCHVACRFNLHCLQKKKKKKNSQLYNFHYWVYYPFKSRTRTKMLQYQTVWNIQSYQPLTLSWSKCIHLAAPSV